MRISFSRIWQKTRKVKLPVFLMVIPVLFFFLFFFLFGFFSSFPDDALHNRVIAEVNSLLPDGNMFEADSVSLGFPLQLQIDQARLILDPLLLPEQTLSMVALRPTLATLIGKPGLAVNALSDWGIVDGTISSSGVADLHLHDGRFNLPLPGMGALQLAGGINTVDLVGHLQSTKDDALRFDATLDDLVLTGGETFGLSQNNIDLGQLTLGLSGAGRSLQIDQLKVAGGAVEVTGSGRIIVQQPFAASRLELNLQVRPGADAGSGLRTLLELLGPTGKDGAHAVQLRGRLFAPQLK